jgi:hypothetical protein
MEGFGDEEEGRFGWMGLAFSGWEWTRHADRIGDFAQRHKGSVPRGVKKWTSGDSLV